MVFNRGKSAGSGSSNSKQRLRKLVPLNMLPEQDLARLLENAKFEQLKKDDYLFRQGETKSQNVYLIEGKVSLLADGKEVDTVVAGSDTARFPLAHQIPRKNSARAKGRVECIRIDTHLLSDLLANTGNESGQADDLDSSAADDWMTQLLQSKVFQQIPASNIQSVMMRMEETQVSAGDEIIRQGDSGDYFYLIHRGRCSVTKSKSKGAEPVELAQLGPGDSFGEEALLSESPRGSSVTMLTDGVLLRLSKEDFIEFVKRPLAHSISYSEGLSRVEQGAVWLDVRSAEEYEKSHIKGSVNLPVHLVRYQAATLAPNRHYIAYCETGQQSATAAFLLIELGLEVSVLGEGGFSSVPPEGLHDTHQEEDERAKVISLESGEELSDGEEAGAAGANLKVLQDKLKRLQEDKKKTTVQWLTERKTLKLAIAKAQVKLTALEQERDSAHSDTKQVEEKLAASMQQRDAARSELEKLKAEIEASSAGERASEGQIKELLQRQVVTAQERDAVQRELEELQAKMAASSAGEKELEELKAKMAATSAEERESAEQIAQLQHELAAIAQEKAEERSKLEQLQAEMAASSAGEQESEGELKKLRQKQAVIAQERDAAISELEDLKATVTTSSAGEKELEWRLSQLQDELAVVAQERDEGRSKLERLQSKMAASSTEEREHEEQIEQLQRELAVIAQEKSEERGKLEQLQAEMAASNAGEKEHEKQIKLLQKALTAVTQERDEGHTQLERLQAEMAASSAEPKGSGKLAKKLQLEQEIMAKELERVRSEAKEREAKDEAKIAYLSEELDGLRTQMIQLSTIEKDTKSGADKDELKALRTELDFVRSQAASDMAILQERLTEAEASDGTGKVVEQEAVRQDIKRLESTIKQHQKRIAKADVERQKLEDALEERDAKLDQLKQKLEDAHGEAEEAGYGRKEAEQARAQVEAVLYTLKQEVEEESAARERIDAHFKHSGKALDLSDITGKRISIKSIMLGVLVGIGLLFMLLEGYMIFSGKGELISTLRVSSTSSLEQEAGGTTRVVDIDRQGESGATSGAQSSDTAKKKPSKPKLRGKVITGTVLTGADIGPVMLMIAGGEFTMGSNRNQISAAERPAHKVVLQDFAISRNEVTFEEYDRFAEATGRPLPDDNGWGRGKRPVINVNWADASAYARWLSARAGKRYRLPSEAEWEYAAAGGSDSVYWWGYELESGRANCFDCGSGWDRQSTAPVGRFGPNGFGLHDTAGNVREWVRDCYHSSYAGAPVDGSAWEESGCKERVVRGGAYDKPAESMRSTWRGYLKADTRLPMIGFRLVQEL